MAKRAYVVTDISFGDAGKGTTVDFLAHQAKTTAVIRHNGGPQAAHNVITSDGRHHTFAQFGSGMFVPGTSTHLSRFMVVNPLNMLYEARHLVELGEMDVWKRTTVDAAAPLILPWHQAANRLRELARGDSPHGTTGLGVSEVKLDLRQAPDSVLRVGDLWSPGLIGRLEALRRAKYLQLLNELEVPAGDIAGDEWMVLHDSGVIPWLCDQLDEWIGVARIVSGDYLARLADTHDQLVFEGAQGVLLDEAFGFHPYTTWSDATPRGAMKLLSEIGFHEPVTKLGIIRAYTTRHGYGPFVTEDPALAAPLREYHNDAWQWQGQFRYGHLDLLAHRYAIEVSGGLDALVVTGLDRLKEQTQWRYAAAYQLMGQAPPDVTDYLQFNGSGLVTAIKPFSYGDRPHQARLTEMMELCTPVYSTIHCPTSAQAQEAEAVLLQACEDVLGLRVSITSHGPTAVDKQVLVPVT